MFFGVIWGSLGYVVGGIGICWAVLVVAKFLCGDPWVPLLAPEEPSTAPKSSPGALMARQMVP